MIFICIEIHTLSLLDLFLTALCHLTRLNHKQKKKITKNDFNEARSTWRTFLLTWLGSSAAGRRCVRRVLHFEVLLHTFRDTGEHTAGSGRLERLHLPALQCLTPRQPFTPRQSQLLRGKDKFLARWDREIFFSLTASVFFWTDLSGNGFLTDSQVRWKLDQVSLFAEI